MPLNLVKKAYIAGIIDGEGTITLSRKHVNETPSPVVSISNCNLELLTWIKKSVGNGIIQTKKAAKINHSTGYEFRLKGNKAIEFLKEIKRFLRIKRIHAELIISDYKLVTPRNGKYSQDQLRRKSKLVEKIRKLNQR